MKQYTQFYIFLQTKFYLILTVRKLTFCDNTEYFVSDILRETN
jgi:hypothetical protein